MIMTFSKRADKVNKSSVKDDVLQFVKWYGLQVKVNAWMGWIIFGFLIIMFLFVFVWAFSWSNNEKFYFAGEEVLMKWEYVINREKLDREIALSLMSPAQLVMIHRRERQYLPYIEKKLKEYDIPDDFKYLAVAESALRNVAVSTAGAAGIRQFMPATARRYGLVVNDSVDERFDFEKSTNAAMRYLRDLYGMFGNWTLVAAAYNRGENGLQRDLDRQFVDNYYDALLNNETARYVYRIVALKNIMENRYDYVARSILWTNYKNHDTDVVSVGRIENLARWASENGYTYLQIRELNPWIRWNSLPDGEWNIKVWSR